MKNYQKVEKRQVLKSQLDSQKSACHPVPDIVYTFTKDTLTKELTLSGSIRQWKSDRASKVSSILKNHLDSQKSARYPVSNVVYTLTKELTLSKSIRQQKSGRSSKISSILKSELATPFPMYND